MGGDRDGNPFVTPDTTRDVVIGARLSAATLLTEQVCGRGHGSSAVPPAVAPSQGCASAAAADALPHDNHHRRQRLATPMLAHAG